MKFKFFTFKQFSFAATFAILCLLVISSGTAFGQKKPKTLKLDVDTDDRQLCSRSPVKGVERIANSEFCDYYTQYHDPKSTEAQKQAYRNEMIELVRGQVDTYYKLRKDGRRDTIRWLQMLFDILEVGSSTAIAIMNGERAKTVVGAALSGFQSGRTAYNRNFDILNTQILINTMNTNRATKMTAILKKRELSTKAYSWYAAKNDLRDYFFAGTYSNAMDTLVEETGANVARAERALRVEETGPLVPAATRTQFLTSRDARVIKDKLKADLASEDEDLVNNATKKLKTIVEKLEAADAEFETLLSEKDISSSTNDGQKIYDALQLIIEELPETEGRRGRELVNTINQAFIDVERENN